jgi:hypothetical protein
VRNVIWKSIIKGNEPNTPEDIFRMSIPLVSTIYLLKKYLAIKIYW